jgi:biotin synthase
MQTIAIQEAGQVVINSGEGISKETAYELLEIPDSEILLLAYAANQVRERFMGKKVDLCTLINAKSGRCSEDCAFCSQSKHYQTGVAEYEFVSVEQVISAAKSAERNGVHEFCIVAAWKTIPDEIFPKVKEAVRAVKQNTHLQVTCSLGFLTDQQAKELKEAGADKYNHNLESASSHYGNICTTHTHQQRTNTIEQIHAAGLESCCGGILGMGETPRQRIDLAFEWKALNVACIPVNILNPRPGTPLAELEPLPPMEIIKTIAIYRLILPKAVIKVAGGRERNLRDLQATALMAGANGLIVGNYLTTLGRDPEEDLQMIKDLGLEV